MISLDLQDYDRLMSETVKGAQQEWVHREHQNPNNMQAYQARVREFDNTIREFTDNFQYNGQ